MLRKFRLVIGFLALAACQEASPPVTADPIATIRQAGYYAPILNLEIDFGESRSPAMITEAGKEVLSIGNAINAGKSPVSGKIDAINFVILGGKGSDATVGRKIVQFTYDAQELRQLASSRKLNGNTILDSAREIGSWTPANDDVVTGYCEARSHSPFCMQVQ